AEKARQAEVVSPILRYEDIETLQEVIRAVRRAGARVDTSCGIHVHVDAARFDAKALRNLV
ncbi:MAG TPA: amidoligase, partial [Planctomycetes bacterium]|nr:amidoligase [Planctomycetota bacterium]